MLHHKKASPVVLVEKIPDTGMLTLLPGLMYLILLMAFSDTNNVMSFVRVVWPPSPLVSSFELLPHSTEALFQRVG